MTACSLVLLQVNLTSAAQHCFGLMLPRMQGVSAPVLTAKTHTSYNTSQA